MSKRLTVFFLILGFAFLMASCGPTGVPAAEPVIPTALPATIAPPTALPPTAIPPTVAPIEQELIITPTEMPVSEIGLPAGCVDALTITKAHVGETLCVGGIVGSIWNIETDYHIIFKGADFHTIILVSFNWPPMGDGQKGAEPGDCVYLEKAKITMDVERYLNAAFLPGELKRCAPPSLSGAGPTGQPGVAPTKKSAPLHKIPEGCLDALIVTADQVGQTVCVGGIVEQDFGMKGDYFLYFKKSSLTTLFFISLNWPTFGVVGVYPGDCVYLEKAKISRRGEQSIVAMFTPQELKWCK
jgi:hypothetical protein